MIGNRLHQARLLAGLTQDAVAAQLTNTGYPATKAVISKYEKNKSVPSSQFLILVAAILDVPAAYFTHQPTAEMNWLAFRRHSKLPVQQQEVIKAYALDIAELQIELHALLHPVTKANLPQPMTVASVEDAEHAAMQLRRAWKLEDRPIDSLIQTTEDQHIIIVDWRKPLLRFDGLSGWCGQHPVTVISTLVEPVRRRFTLAHELGHLVMDTAAVSEKEAEKLANRFAAALIVPPERAFHELGARRTHLDWQELSILKRKYGLSMAAWVYRAKDLGIITEHYAAKLYQEIGKRGWRKREPVEYIADEMPLKLEQMAHRAVAEGLISADQIGRVYPDWFDQELALPLRSSERFTIYDLLQLPEEQQQRVMEEAFAVASEAEIEIFEASEFLEEMEGTH